MKNYFKAMRHYFDFHGRASRSEFWLFQLGYLLLMVGSGIVASTQGLGDEEVAIVVGVVNLVHFLPGIAVSARRLHDINMSGWWQLIGIIPLAALALFLFWCKRSNHGSNDFGPAPGGIEAETADTRDISPAESPYGASAPLSTHPIDTASTARAGDIVAQLEKLSDLHTAEVIDHDEFARLKADLIAKLD